MPDALRLLLPGQLGQSGALAGLRAGPPGVSGPARVVETHTSVLFFVDDVVCKLKKPVNLGFLDFHTSEARRAACEAEVELNRRLSPDVYLGLADISGADGRVWDTLVVMRRMPDDRRLSALVSEPSMPRLGGKLEAALRALSRQLAAFHSRCETSESIAAAADPDALRRLWLDNLAVMHRFCGQVLTAPTVNLIECLALEYLAGREPLLRRRQQLGLIRDGHGDLLADDVFILDDGPRVLDCLEFDPQLRHGDVLADIAFLAMDLERLGASTAARFFLDSYGEFSGEHHPRSLEDLYIGYRATVRSKVACLRWEQGDPEAAALARRFAELAVRHLKRSRIQLVLVGGLPGTGKSTLASAICATDATDWTLLRSDVVRKELAGLRPTESAAAAFGCGLYRPELKARTYAELFTRARHALEQGESVVVDASFTSAEQRQVAARIARETSAELVELECQAPGDVIAERLARRARLSTTEGGAGDQVSDAVSGAGSDADYSILLAMAEVADPWPSATIVNTEPPIPVVLRGVRAALDGPGAERI